MDGEWIEHDGEGCPLPPGTPIDVIFEGRPGEILGPFPCLANPEGLSWFWRWWGLEMPDGFVARILRYRVRRSKALEQLREIAANPTAPLKERRPSREMA